MFMRENATHNSEDISFRVTILSLSLTAACCIFSNVDYLKISPKNFTSVPTNLARGARGGRGQQQSDMLGSSWHYQRLPDCWIHSSRYWLALDLTPGLPLAMLRRHCKRKHRGFTVCRRGNYPIFSFENFVCKIFHKISVCSS